MRWAVFLFMWILAVILIFIGLLASNACADGINFNSELTFTGSDSKTKIKTTGESIDSEFYSFEQRYNLNIAKTIYPYLTFQTGTIFEWNNTRSKTEGTTIKMEERILRPFVGLNLNNPIYQAGVEYRRTEIHEDVTDLPNTENIRDEFDATLVWKPVDLPLFDLRYNQTHTYDDPETVDTIDKLFTLRSTYTAWKELRFDYLYTRLDTENRISDFDTLAQNHFGKVEYSHYFLDRRLFVNTNYRIRYDTLEFPGSGTAQSPLQRFEGLFSLDNTPQDGPALAVNNELIDGNLTASTGIDIGLAGDQTTLTNIGLDLGIAVNVDEIHIWVDRSLSTSVADSFSWDVYTSPDNTDSSTWTLVATISPANFGTFDNRFEILFTEVNTRFIKVVTTPLSPAVPGAASFPNIFVTEMQAFITLSGIAVQNKFTNVDHNYDLNFRGRLSDKTVLGYNLQFLREDREAPSRDRTQLFNNIYLNHIFNRVFSSSARFSRRDDKVDDDDTVTYDYSAFLKGAYLPTFNQTLTFSGRNRDEDEGTSYDYSLFLRSNSTLYRGWSAFVDLGYTWSRLFDDTRTTSQVMRLGTNIVPNNKITFNINYSLKKTEQRNGVNRDTSDSELDLEAFFTPFRTLSITARINYVNREDLDSTLQQYFVSWSPFPDGALQFFFTYNELLNPGEDRRERTIGPGLNWDLSRHFSLEIFYNTAKSETNTQKTDTNNVRAELRINF